MKHTKITKTGKLYKKKQTKKKYKKKRKEKPLKSIWIVNVFLFDFSSLFINFSDGHFQQLFYMSICINIFHTDVVFGNTLHLRFLPSVNIYKVYNIYKQ